jgi:uncharacterized protein YndB with AHSA1/START domain
VVIRRRMPAPREVVFEAWIDPEGMQEWMCPGDVVSAEAIMDVRVGGSFRIAARYRWHKQPYYEIRLAVFQPKHLTGCFITEPARHSPGDVETQMVPVRLRLCRRMAWRQRDRR